MKVMILLTSRTLNQFCFFDSVFPSFFFFYKNDDKYPVSQMLININFLEQP